MQHVLIQLVTAAALARSAWLVVGIARLAPVHLRARLRRWGPTELLTLAELPLFLALTGLLVARPPAPRLLGAAGAASAALGAALAVAGVAISVWAIATTYRRGVILDGGHFVKREHPLVTAGAYGFVRHPMYVGVALLWLGIGAALQHPLVLLATAAYVLPVYGLYARAEERMMLREFGEPYERYMRRVGGWLPRLGSSGAAT